MEQDKIELLQAIHNLMALQPRLLTDEAFDRYNVLLDEADKANIIW